MHLKEYPYLKHHIKASFDICCVRDVMTSPVVTVNEIETAGSLEDLLLQTEYGGFPVVIEHTMQYVGFIRRDQIVALLECGIYMQGSHEDLSHSLTITKTLQNAKKRSFERALLRDDDIYTGGSSRTVRATNTGWLQDNVIIQCESDNIVSDDTLPKESRVAVDSVVDFGPQGNLVVRIPPRDRSRRVDIAAAMNKGAYTVVENTPLSKAYTLFSALGLRFLVVLGNNGQVVGIISRSNLMPEFMEHRTGILMH